MTSRSEQTRRADLLDEATEPVLPIAEAVEAALAEQISLPSPAEAGEGAPETPDAVPAKRPRRRRPRPRPEPPTPEDEIRARALLATCTAAARQLSTSVFAVWGRIARRRDLALSDEEATQMGEAWAPILVAHAEQIGSAMLYLGPIALTYQLVDRRLATPPVAPSEEGTP